MTESPAFMEGDVVLHRDGDLPETVQAVEPMNGPTDNTWLRTTRRFRPAGEFTRTQLYIPRE